MKTSLTCVFLVFISFSALAQRGLLIGESNSPIGSHLLFHPLEKGLPIFNHFIKQNHFKHSSTQFNTSLTKLEGLEKEVAMRAHQIHQLAFFKLKVNLLKSKNKQFSHLMV